MATDKIVRIVPAAPYLGAIGYPYSQTHPNVEQDVPEAEADELVAAGAFRFDDPPPKSAKSAKPTEDPAPKAGSLDSAANAADGRSVTA
jgi:hypothetical protein